MVDLHPGLWRGLAYGKGGESSQGKKYRLLEIAKCLVLAGTEFLLCSDPLSLT